MNNLLMKAYEDIFSGWPADLEFQETWKSQGILMRNWEKSGKFTCAKRIWPKFFQNSFKWWTRINHACSYIMHARGFLSKNKNELKLWNTPFFLLLLDQKVYCYWLNLLHMQGWDFSIWIQLFLFILFSEEFLFCESKHNHVLFLYSS